MFDDLAGYAKDNYYVNEYALVILISQVSEDTIRAFAEKVREVLEQDAVLLSKVDAQIEFIAQY